MIDSLAIWKSTFDSIELTSDGSWTTIMSDWIEARVTNAVVSEITHATPPFTFNKSALKTALDSLLPVIDQNAGSVSFANAWKTAIDASTYQTVSGDNVNPPPAVPSNTWSLISSSLIDASSITTAVSQLTSDLQSLNLVTDPDLSDFPLALRDAFLALTISVTGTDSLTPPSGPNALNVSGVSLT